MPSKLWEPIISVFRSVKSDARVFHLLFRFYFCFFFSCFFFVLFLLRRMCILSHKVKYSIEMHVLRFPERTFQSNVKYKRAAFACVSSSKERDVLGVLATSGRYWTSCPSCDLRTELHTSSWGLTSRWYVHRSINLFCLSSSKQIFENLESPGLPDNFIFLEHERFPYSHSYRTK